jgi:methylglyoxal synthase
MLNIAFIAHDRKKDEMVNFVIAYEHVFVPHKHTYYGTNQFVH